jgi:hypothetical protein
MLNKHFKPFEICVMLEYKSFHCENAHGLSENKVVQNNLVLLGDLEFILGLPCVNPMLEVVHILIKCQDLFIIEFVHVCQICNGQLKFQILHDLDNLK